MKLNLSDIPAWNLITRCTAILGVVIILASLTSLRRSERNLERCERNDALMQRIVDAARMNDLLQRLNYSDADGLKETLTTRLACNLLDLRSTLSKADPAARDFIQRASARIVREEQAQPESYLTSLPKSRSGEIKLWGILAQSATARLADSPSLPGVAENN